MRDPAEHSKFWLGEAPNLDFRDTVGLVRLAAMRRAITNFVYILTGKSIPVRFAETNKSKTDGKVIYIGGELSKGLVDVTVGLVLHESMHIVESDFVYVKTLWGKIPGDMYDLGKLKGMNKNQIAECARLVLNVIEDRYIDARARVICPGYRGYYDALYERYFYRPQISKILKSSKLRRPVWDAYKFRLINLHHPDTDLDALPGLADIAEAIDLDMILRLDKFRYRADLAMTVFRIILENLETPMSAQQPNPPPQSGKPAEPNESEDEEQEEEGGEPESEQNEEQVEEKQDSEDDAKDDASDPTPDEDAGSPDDEQKDEDGSTSEANTDAEDVAPSEDNDPTDEEIEEQMKEQEDFTDHNINPMIVSKEDQQKLKDLEKGGVQVVSVGGGGIPKTSCIVIKDLTDSVMESDIFPYRDAARRMQTAGATNTYAQDGIKLGIALGHKLQIRGEAKVTKYTRQPVGKFDRKRCPDLGYDSESVFYRTTTDAYKRAHAHISIDASSSMENEKWAKTMTVAIAIAKAATMVPNLDVCISVRSGNGPSDKDARPYISIIYDSKKDKIPNLLHRVPKIYPVGSTPEGLTFQAILDLIPQPAPDLDSYFINVSDGQPNFGEASYSGGIAIMHTRRQVEIIRSMGVHVLSYFIETMDMPIKELEENKRAFRMMYGKDSQFIDVSNITQIAYSLNKRFLKKE